MMGQAPRNTLTHPNGGVNNDGYDNENNDLILWSGFVLQSETDISYIVSDILGQGTFGQVAKCICRQTGEVVAVKVIKNQTAFYHQARVEVGVLQYLNRLGDADDQHHIVRMHNFFVFKDHLCLVFELLNLNLYELIKQNQYRGLSMRLLRIFLSQILDALCVLRESQIIHCDLKPENVLLKGQAGEVKVIDFGSACFENRTMYSYIQSRFYRSPEVLLGHAYDMAIDMWSLGCMAAELFLGLPLFPGASEHDLLVRIVDMLGMPPDHVLSKAQHTTRYFRAAEAASPVARPIRSSSSSYKSRYAMLTQAEFEAIHKCNAPAGKRYFQHTKLADIVGAYPMAAGLDDQAALEERQHRESFLDFLLGILDLDPACRWTPRQALQHPFITRASFAGPFQPTPDSPLNIRSPDLDYSSTNIANSQAALMYGAVASQGQSLAAALATSPEVRAQAHLAAMAAVAQLSPHSSFQPAASVPAAYQAAMLQHLEAAMQSASAGPMHMPPRHASQYPQSPYHQQQSSDHAPGGSMNGVSQRPAGYQSVSASRHHTTGSDSAGSSIGGNYTPSMSAHQSPYGSYTMQQQLHQSAPRFGSIPQSPIAVPMQISGQVPSHLPVGSLEALRGGWHAPRGRNAHGDMFASSFTVPSQRIPGAASLAGSLGGSLAGSMGPPRLPPSLNNRPRHSITSSPAGPSGGAVLSPSLATPPTATAPNRIFGFGASAYSDQQLAQQLPRQQSLQQRQQASPQQHSRHRHQSSHEQLEQLFDDWAGQGREAGAAHHMSRQPSLDAPHPSDWDPNFSEDQLLADETGSRAGGHRRLPDADIFVSPQVSTPYQSVDSQQDVHSMPSGSLHDHMPHQLPASMHEQLAQQLPGSFASMSTSFMSPNSGAPGQFDGQMPGQHHSLQGFGPHDPVWSMEGQFAAALQDQQLQHSTSGATWQQASAAQRPGLSQDLQRLLAAHQHNMLSGSLQGAQQQQQQQQQHQLLLAAAAAAAGLQDPLHGTSAGLQPQHHALTSSGSLAARGSSQTLLPASTSNSSSWLF